MDIQSLVPLSHHTTFRIGGPATFFAEAASVSQLLECVLFAKQKSVPIFVLGEGSNVLVSDEGFNGLVIRVRILGVEFPEEELCVAGAGEHWDDVVERAVSMNLSGIENLSWIPGSVGATPVQNIGAYGSEVREVVEWVEVLDTTQGKIKKLSNTECKFGYRDSVFKTPEGKSLIVTRVAFRLQKNGKPNITYKDLAQYFANQTQPTLRQVRSAVIEIRKKKLPDISLVGTAGSFFKNPVITETHYGQLLEKYPELPSFPAKDGYKKIPLAWVLDKICSLNGYVDGNVGLYKTQPLALVNFGNGTAAEIKKLSNYISQKVKEKTGIEIEWEVVSV